MPKRNGQMHLGLLSTVTGSHFASWRYPSSRPDRGTDIDFYVERARVAERAKFDFFFLADGIAIYEGNADNQDKYQAALMRAQPKSLLEPFTLLSALAMATTKLGLATSATTTYNEPYNIARMFASLDHISRGRAGWNVITSANVGEAHNFSRSSHLAHAERYDRAREFVRIVLDLWDTIEDGALIRDKEDGLYMDAAKFHVLNFKGEHFSVRGPLNVPRPPQGHPVVFQAGSSDVGRDLAAETAEVVFTAQTKLESAKAFYADIKARLRKYDRDAESVKIIPGMVPFVGRTESEAREKFERIQSLIPLEFALYMLSDLLGEVDLSPYAVDGMLPEVVPPSNGSASRRDLIIAMARNEKLTIRQLALKVSGASGHRVVIGTPEQVADGMQEWFEAEGADGFNIQPPFLPEAFEDFCSLVVPELQRRGLVRREYAGNTLREHLGLERPVNRLVGHSLAAAAAPGA